MYTNDLTDALLCTGKGSRMILVRTAEDNSVTGVLLDCSPTVLNKLRKVAQEHAASCWELCRSKVYGTLSLQEWVDANHDPTLPSQVPRSIRRRVE